MDEKYYSYVLSSLNTIRNAIVEEDKKTIKLFSYLYNDNIDIRSSIDNIYNNIDNNISYIQCISYIKTDINKILNTLIRTTNDINKKYDLIINKNNVIEQKLNDLISKLEKPKLIDEKQKKKKPKKQNRRINININLNLNIKEKIVKIKNHLTDKINKTHNDIINSIFVFDNILNQIIDEVEQIRRQEQLKREHNEKINKRIKEILNNHGH